MHAYITDKDEYHPCLGVPDDPVVRKPQKEQPRKQMATSKSSAASEAAGPSDGSGSKKKENQ